MRFKSVFSLYRRKIKGGKAVIYYRCYDENDNRGCGHSTGLTSKVAAREYCMKLWRDNMLVRNNNQNIPTFKEFAVGFWDPKTSAFLKSLEARKEIADSYPAMGLLATKNHLIPKFGNIRLDAITDQMVDKWLLSYPDRGLSNATGNHQFKFLSIMLSWAVSNKIIKTNPCKGVQLLKETEKVRELLDTEQIKKLFGPEWDTYWKKY